MIGCYRRRRSWQVTARWGCTTHSACQRVALHDGVHKNVLQQRVQVCGVVHLHVRVCPFMSLCLTSRHNAWPEGRTVARC